MQTALLCPDCGMVYYGEVVPEKCENCGCSSTMFITKKYSELESVSVKKVKREDGLDDVLSQQVPASASETQETVETVDEESVRLGANIIFGVSILFAVISIIVGIVLLVEEMYVAIGFGVALIIFGLILILLGWINRAFIRLFANMSERLTNIDSILSEKKA